MNIAGPNAGGSQVLMKDVGQVDTFRESEKIASQEIVEGPFELSCVTVRIRTRK